MKRLAIIVAALATFPGTGLGQEADSVRVPTRWQAYTNCAPLYIRPLLTGEHVQGLSLESITRPTRSRLRSARLYSDTLSVPYVLVHVHSWSETLFHVSLGLVKELYDPLADDWSWADSWETSWITYSTAFVVQRLMEMADYFIDEYLRVNAEACRSRGGA